MISATAIFVAMWAVMVSAPGTPIGRALHDWLVARPAARLARITRGQIALVVLLTAAVGGVVWLMEGDGVRLLSMAAPELLGWLTTFEIATYLDVAIGAAVAVSTLRLGQLRPRIRDFRGRARRTRPAIRPERQPANDDEVDRRLALAA